MLPEDPWWPVRLGAPDGLIRGDDEVHPEVVDGLRDRLVHHLERVDRGGQHRVGPNHASLNQEGNLEVGESSALADASTLAVHGHAAADHQVHFATWLEDAGIPARVIDELMGHAGGRRGGGAPSHDGSLIGTRYRWTTPEMEVRVVAAIEQRLAVSFAVAAQMRYGDPSRRSLGPAGTVPQ
jgi:hypothetical protein